MSSVASANLHRVKGKSHKNCAAKYEHQADVAAQRFVAGEVNAAHHLTHVAPAGFGLSDSRAEALPSELRSDLEFSFQTDLSAVRIHRDAPANRMADNLSARAFTSGSHIYFGENEFDIGGVEGRRLIAHEVAHAIQQTARVANTTKYRSKVVDVHGAGLPQCWAIPLNSTENPPAIEDVLQHHKENLPHVLLPSSEQTINMMLINHREAVRQNNVAVFWADIAQHVMNDEVHPVLGVQVSGINDIYVISALYDALKASGQFEAAGKILKEYPDVKTTFFSAEVYNQMFEDIPDTDLLFNRLYDLWHTEDWFGNATPRFIQDRTLAFLLSPTASLSRQSIDSSHRLTRQYAETELQRRHGFSIKQNEIYFVAVLVAAEVEEFRYRMLREAFNHTVTLLEGNAVNRALLKAELLSKLASNIYEEYQDKFQRVRMFVSQEERTHTFGDNETAFETDIILTNDFIPSLSEMVSFARRFWEAGFDIRGIANQVNFEDLALDGNEVIRVLNEQVPGLYSELTTLVDGLLEREDDNSLLDPVAFNTKREQLIHNFERGVSQTGDDPAQPGLRRIERTLADRFFSAYPRHRVDDPDTNRDETDHGEFSFDTAAAQQALSEDVWGVVAWGLLISQEVLQLAKQYDLESDRQSVAAQREVDSRATAADMRELYRLRIAHKIKEIAKSVGWTEWTTLAEGIIHGSEVDIEAIYFGTGWVRDETPQVSIIRADFRNRPMETIGGLEPLGTTELFDFVIAEDYRQTSEHIRRVLGIRQGQYALGDEPVINEAVAAARGDLRPERYFIEDYEWVRPYRMENGRLINENEIPSWQLLGSHPLTRRLLRARNAQMPNQLYWLANRTFDRQKRKEICVLWIIPKPVALIERLQQIDELNEIIVARLNIILNPANQAGVENIDRLLDLLPGMRSFLQDRSSFRENADSALTRGVTLETITVEQLKALNYDVWWRILEFARDSIHFIRDPELLRRMREAITGTDLLDALEQERESALEQLLLDQRKALAHERRRRIEASIRPGLENYSRRSFGQYRIPGESGVSIKRSLAEETAELLSSTLFGFGEVDERQSHTAMAVLELADTIHDKLLEDESLRVIHRWLPLIDAAIAWTQDSDKGGNVAYRESFTVPEESGNLFLFITRVAQLNAVLDHMAEVLRREILEWGIIGTKGDGTVENTGHIHPKDDENRQLGRGYVFTIHGVTWEILEVKENFRFHPAAFPLQSRPNMSAADSILYINGTEYSQGATRPHTLLMYVRQNESPDITEVYADTHERLLTDLTWAAHLHATIAQLQDLAEAIEVGATVIIDLAEFFPVAGQAVAAARLITTATQFMASDLPQMMDDLVRNPHQLLDTIYGQLQTQLSVDHLIQYLIFSNANNIGLRMAENRVRHSPGGSSRRWRRLAQKLQRLVAGVVRVFNRTQDGVQDRRQSVEHLVQNSPHASFIIAFIADHYHEILGVLSRLNQLQGYAEFVSAQNGFSEETLKAQLDEMIGKMGEVELPADILPLEEIIHALIDVVGHRLGGKYRLGIRVLLALLDAVGATDRIVGGIAGLIREAFQRITGGTITDSILPVWRNDIVPEIEDKLGEGQDFVADTIEELFGFFNIDLNLADPQPNIQLVGNDFPEADPNEGRMAQPSLESNVDEQMRLRSGGSAMSMSRAGEVLNRLPGLGGEPLSDGFRQDVERRFGQDFSDVRIHRTTALSDMMDAIGANALTSGSYIFMSRNFNGDSEQKRVLYHELAHVVQQTGSRPLGQRNNRAPRLGRGRGGVRFDPHAEAEADAAAAAALRGDSRPVRISSTGVQPNMVELFGIRFLRQLTDISSLEEEVADIDSSEGTTGTSLIGQDVRAAVRGVDERLTAIFANSSATNGLTVIRTMRGKFNSKLPVIREHLQNNQADINQAIEDIAIRASFIARRGTDGRPPTMGLDINDFTRRLERYILGKTGILLELEANTTGRGSSKRFASTSRPYNSAKIKFVYLPAIHGNSRLWRELLEEKFPNESNDERARWRRNLRSVLQDLGTSLSIWTDNYELTANVYDAAERLGELRSTPGLDAASLPAKNDYLNTDTDAITTGGVGNIRLHLGTYDQKGAQQSGRERESHHITQYLLVQYFHNGSSANPVPGDQNLLGFPLARDHDDAYPGLDVNSSSHRPIQFRGTTTVQISELEQGRGGKMPTILLARPTHRRGNLHINPSADDFDGVSVSTQGAALNHIYTNLLPQNLRDKEQEVAAGNAPYSEWRDLIDGREDAVRGQIYRAMQGTYNYMRNYMQTQLKKALKTNEKNYYNDLYAAANPGSTNRPMEDSDMETVWTKAVIHNREGRGNHRGMRDYGWRDN